MKTHHLQTVTGRSLLAAITLGLAAGAFDSSAADKTWDGGGDGVNWSASPANWDLDTAPLSGDRLFFGGTVGLAPNNDFPANTAFSGLTFNTGAGSFTLTGNTVNMAGGLTNNSANLQTINLNLNNTATRTYNAVAGPIVCANVVTTSIIKEGTNSLTLAGGTGNSGVGPTINNGTLILAKSAGNAVNSTVLVNTNGTLRIVGSGTYQDQIHFNQRVIMNGGLFQLQHVDSVNTTRLEEIASLSGSNLNSIVENGLANSTNRLDLGGGTGHRGIYSGTIRDGAAGVLSMQIYRANNYYQFNGTNTYTGVTLVNNTAASGAARLLVNGKHTGGNNYTVNGSSTDATRVAYLGGSGIISATVINFGANSFLSPGGALSADLSDAATFADTTAILTLSNAVNLNAASSTLEVQINGSTAGSGYDQVNLSGTGSLSNNSANLKLTIGYTPAVGDKFTIVKVPGTDPTNNVGIFASLNGVATDLSQGATFIDPGSGKYFKISYRAEGTTFDMGAGLGNDIMLQAVAAPGANLTWRGDVSSAWDVATTANWRTSGGAASTFSATDNAIFNDSGSNAAPIDLTTDLTPGNVTVDATKDYIFETSTAGKLTGTVVLLKTNAGTLTMLTDNNNAGSTIINAGTLQVGTNATSGTLSGSITINTNGTLAHNRSDDVTLTTALSGTGTLLHKGDGALILAADSPSFTGRTTNRGGLLQLGTGAGALGSLGGDINVGGTNVLRYYYAGDPTIGNSRSGSGTVIFEAASGNRSFTIPTSVVSSNFSGSNVLTAGVRLHCSDFNSGYSLGNGGSILVPDLAQVWLDRSTTVYNQEFFLAGNGFTADTTPLGAMRIFGCTVSGPVHLLADTRFGGSINGGTIVGKIDGAFQLEVLGNVNSFILSLGPTNGANTYGSTLVTSGAIRALNSDGISPGPLTVDLNGDVQVYGNNVTVANLNNGVNGAGMIRNMHATTNGTLIVGTDGSSTTFDGVLGNGAAASLGLTKVGAGTLTLSGVNTNTGAVTVSDGTLALSGVGSFANASKILVGSGAFYDVTLAGGTLTLNSGQTLGGSGTINGSLVASAGSVIAPGASVGPLTVANDITLGGGMTMELDRSATPNSDRLVSTSGTITGGGTLTATNIGPALQAGDTFQLFTTGVSDITPNLQTTDWRNLRTYTWQDNLASLGSVKVLTSTVLPPPTIGITRSGNSLTFTWDGPFKLQAQTNALSVGISNNWTDYPGGSPSPVSVTINPTNPAVFFRLLLQ